jgi:Outer membrane protein beta-barrel domain
VRTKGSSFWRSLAIAVLLAAPAGAQSREYPSDLSSDYGQDDSGGGASRDGAGPFSLRGGLGFSAGPTGFLFGLEGDYEVVDQISLGANVQVGVGDDVTIVSPSLFARYRIDLAGIDESLSDVEPSLRLGVGFTHWDRDVPFNRSIDDTVFLLDLGTGLEYRVSPHFAVGTLMHFNVMPTGVFEDRPQQDKFYFAWEVVTFRFQF